MENPGRRSRMTDAEGGAMAHIATMGQPQSAPRYFIPHLSLATCLYPIPIGLKTTAGLLATGTILLRWLLLNALITRYSFL